MSNEIEGFFSPEDIKGVVLAKEKEGKVCFLTFDGLMSADLDSFVKQPIDGLLYDLNRGPEVVLSFISDPKWINDYAVSLVIRRLKEKLEGAA